MEEVKTYSSKMLEKFAADVLEKLGVASEDAKATALALVNANLLGVETHGLILLPTHLGYVKGIQKGYINPKPRRKVVNETVTTALLDGDGGLGTATGTIAMEMAIEKAKKTGAGFVATTNQRHIAMAGHYSLMAAEQDMIGFSFQNVTPIMVPAGGAKAMLGNNPLSVAAPTNKEPTFLLDIALSAVAGMKVVMSSMNDKSVPLGWIVDADGRDTTNPRDFLDEEIKPGGGAMLPLGSSAENSYHKGYGLAMVVEILAGILSGYGWSKMLNNETLELGSFFGALSIEAFRSVDDFKSMMDDMISSLRNSPPAPGFDRVMVPGEREFYTQIERLEKGIPLQAKLVSQLESLGHETGIPFGKE